MSGWAWCGPMACTGSWKTSVHDGSLFPTSVGANPQLSVYGVVNRLAQGLVQRLTGQAEAQALA